MWGLPDIVKMNEEAHKKALSGKPLEWYIDRRIDPETGEPAQCYYQSSACDGEVGGVLWYDVFSGDPRGVLFLCDHHAQVCGCPDGYFQCVSCDLVYITNYTWEPYGVYDSLEGGVLCLDCCAEKVISNPKSWIALKQSGITLREDDLGKVKHIFAQGGSRHGLEQIGDSVLYERDWVHVGTKAERHLWPLEQLLQQARQEGYSKALLAVDGVYQFGYSVGVYVQPQERASSKE